MEHKHEDKTPHIRSDHDRRRRCGWPEVIYGAGKTAAQIAESFRLLQADDDDETQPVFATLCTREQFTAVSRELPGLFYDETARIIYSERPETCRGLVVICCAGTSDLPVAEEAALTAELMGAEVRRLYDVGVAGIHRLLAEEPLLQEAKAVVVAAGMEGALPSVVSGLTQAPVIAVPTSVGYGASFGGLAALLAMLNSCASGMSVVNIDNGFGAGYLAAMINAQSV
jgi:pyridinium-3,5-biscarboxylic acid mononucleotide synthase